MTTEFFVTSDIEASVRQAHGDFTHVILNRLYALPRPIFFKSAGLVDLPIFLYAPWDTGTYGSRDAWRKQGGILIDRGGWAKDVGAHDAQVLVECPIDRKLLNRATINTENRVVIFKPPTWKEHERTVGLKAPDPAVVKKLWGALHRVPDRAALARISKYPDSLFVMTVSELSAASGITSRDVSGVKRALKPQEVWQVRLRLVPEEPGLRATWDMIKAQPNADGTYCFADLGVPKGLVWRRAIREMARMGYITALRAYVFPTSEPDYTQVARRRAKRVNAFAEFREFVESLPVHP